MATATTVETFQDITPSLIDPSSFGINLLLAAIMAAVLSYVYRKFSPVMSDRNSLARTFFMLSCITLTVITVVKTSLALSLGLVGALSIIRFRAAIKDPEELTFIFLAMAVGLGLGAEQREITVLAFTFIVIVYCVVQFFKKNKSSDFYNLILSSNSSATDLQEQILDTLNKHCSSIRLKRFDSTAEKSEYCFGVEINNISELNAIRKEITQKCPDIEISFLDIKGLIR